MTLSTVFNRISGHAGLNFVLTNRIPRRTATRLAGWLARSQQPVVRAVSLWMFRTFCTPDLSEAKKTHFDNLRDCFIRELKDGARPIDFSPDTLTSPCDGIVVATGAIQAGTLLQVKGSTYALAELLRDATLAADFANGRYVTLRLTAGMYHRFHAPHDSTVTSVSHIAGDVWNVNPPTLARVPRLYCRNERAVLTMELAASRHSIVLVPVAAVLVAGLHLNFASLPADRFHAETWTRPCAATFLKGAQMGWFEHGSTIIVIVPPGFAPVPPLQEGATIRMGEPLLRLSQNRPCGSTRTAA